MANGKNGGAQFCTSRLAELTTTPSAGFFTRKTLFSPAYPVQSRSQTTLNTSVGTAETTSAVIRAARVATRRFTRSEREGQTAHTQQSSSGRLLFLPPVIRAAAISEARV